MALNTISNFNVQCILFFYSFFSLGPLNSRLLRYYCEFDGRVPTIITFVKLWRQMMSISSVRLNSYALSLMVIYSLQHCSPPVLPCLHDPIGWPLNMDAFQTLGQHKFSDHENPLSDSPWHCGFTSPDSLLPSINKQSTGELCCSNCWGLL